MSVLTHKEAYVDVSIGARIKAARTAAAMTQMDVARRTDLSLQAVGDIERGIVRDPHISSLRQIAYALGVSVEMLVNEEMAVPAFPLGDFEEHAALSADRWQRPQERERRRKLAQGLRELRMGRYANLQARAMLLHAQVLVDEIFA